MPGTYLFVVMVGDTEYIRLIHEEDLVRDGAIAGHSSLVERSEFMRSWSRHWEDSNAGYRHTVLYAGELLYEPGVGVVTWNNHSGHYMPDGRHHNRVAFDSDTFVPVDQ